MGRDKKDFYDNLLSHCLMLKCFHDEGIYAVNDDDQSDVEYVPSQEETEKIMITKQQTLLSITHKTF